MSASDNLSPGQVEKFRLFDPPEEPPIRDVSIHLKNAAHWHSSKTPEIPTQEEPWRHEAPDESRWSAGHGHPLGLHVGTGWAAYDRMRDTGRGIMIPFRLQGESATVADEHSRAMTDWGDDYDEDGELWDDAAANGKDPASTRAIRRGENVHYINSSEDTGSISVRAPRQNLATWAEHVVRNPHLYDYHERRAAASGADLIYTKDDEQDSRRNAAPQGLTATPITVSPSGAARDDWEAASDWVDDPDDIMPLPEDTIHPKWVYPHRQAAQKRRQEAREQRAQDPRLF